ncbi:hypothetical protein VZT92_026746 [Zoarces viviparus]|uniref:Uncharacterized protein n=1 Tax=Zoarces viviparus TaxID=48416 RepID=A0AAW1DSZ9_ZOAVI
MYPRSNRSGKALWCRLLRLLASLKEVQSTRFIACCAPAAGGEASSTLSTGRDIWPEERQWVPARNICDPQLIASFHRQHPEQLSRTRMTARNPQQVPGADEGPSSGPKTPNQPDGDSDSAASEEF